jgi:hypothetical protein
MSVTQASLLGDTLGNKASGTIPVGGIIMWSGGSVPTGWALCNGNNGTPDLRNRFIVSSGSGYAVGATGGSADAVLVSHGHTATSTVTDTGHSHLMNYQQKAVEDTGGAQVSDMRFAGGDGDGGSTNYANESGNIVGNVTGVTVATTITAEGESGTNKNLPPYYALAFIMRVS